MKLVDNAGMREIDRLAQEEYGIPEEILMENAGIRLWEALERELSPDHAQSICFIAGGGNNGGDALVMARQAWNRGFRRISIISLKKEPSGWAGRWLSVAEGLGIPVLRDPGEEELSRAIAEAAILVDGITGTGISGPLRDDLAQRIELIAAAEECIVAAVDAPSGIGDEFRDGYPVLPADITLTVTPPKEALYQSAARPACGRIIPVEIGFPEGALNRVAGSILMDRCEVARRLQPYPAVTYKNRRGVLAVRAGSPGGVGAAFLAAEGAARAGAGLVSLYLDSGMSLEGFAGPRALMLHCEPDQLAALADEPDQYDALLLGPGWGRSSRKEEFLRLTAAHNRGLIDADGLFWLASNPRALSGEWVLTPHPGECALLLGKPKAEILADPRGAAEETARTYGATVILKGHVSVVADGEGACAYVDGMNPALATGGSGDILAGIVAGLLCDLKLSPFDAAAAGAYLHQQAGRVARDRTGGFIADDLLAEVSRATGGYRYAGA